jgi:hypothetical protein
MKVEGVNDLQNPTAGGNGCIWLIGVRTGRKGSVVLTLALRQVLKWSPVPSPPLRLPTDFLEQL